MENTKTFNITKEFISFVRGLYQTDQFIPLHEPRFVSTEKKYVNDAIDSTFVSSVGEYVNKIEKDLAAFTGAPYCVATVNGTSALHTALILSDVSYNDEVITQPVSFVATTNAIRYCGAFPTFVDVELDSLGMCPKALKAFLKNDTTSKNGKLYNKHTDRLIKAICPMHTFGHPCKIDEIISIANKANLPVIEDAAESLGSTYKDKHTGTFGRFGTLSFNGNKVITAGGGGAILVQNEEDYNKAKHLTTTAKTPHKWEYVHDDIGYNYRMPNLNAALLCAQLEQCQNFIENKRELALNYKNFFEKYEIPFICEPENSFSNYWLNTILLPNLEQRNIFLEEANNNGIMCRPLWTLLSELKINQDCYSCDIPNSVHIKEKAVNIPSSVRNQK